MAAGDDDDNGPPAAGPFVLPGTYHVQLTADGKGFQQTLTVQMDPRSVATAAELKEQFFWAQKVYISMAEAETAIAKLTEMDKVRHKDLIAALQVLSRSLSGLLSALESADRTPPSQVIAAYRETMQKLAPRLEEARRLSASASPL